MNKITSDFSREEIETLLRSVDILDEEELVEIEKMLEELDKRAAIQAAKDDLIAFCQRMDPEYKVGRHHRRLADQLMALESGLKDRACVNMPPRHGKSQLVSIYYPAWFLGRNPTKKVMMVSHTTDLAVDFGRKVRNLIDTDAYREIFPLVKLASDSKSAGRWNTNQGGEYFACIRPETEVTTLRGKRRADEVLPGDIILSAEGFVPVCSTMRTTHDKTIHLAGAGYSTEHPIWTMNRGWVEAENILSTDVLCSESILDKLLAITRRIANGIVEHAYVSALVQPEIALPESEKPEVSKLRRAWDHARSAMGELRNLFVGYGPPAFAEAHSGQNRQRRPVQSGELSVGNCRTAAEQQTDLCTDRGTHAGATCAILGFDTRGVAVSDVSKTGRAESEEATQSEHAHSGPPAGLGWFRRSAARLLAGSGPSAQPGRPGKGAKRHLACLPEKAQKLCGLLLGVRYAGRVIREEHDPKEFVNFRVGGSNTFFSDGVLTHNCGIGSALAGRGADLLLVDDPHSEQDILNGNYSAFVKAYEWFAYGARTRLMPGGRVVVIATRWHQDDLCGRLQRDMVNNEDADQYEVVEFPAILDVVQKDPDTGEESYIQKPLWPEFFDLPALLRTKASMPLFQWNSQYMQNPTGEEAAIIKREWWRIWPDDDPPAVEYIIMSLDAAAEAHNRADFTSLTTWGVFFNEEENMHQIILLNAIKQRLEFPELKKLAMEEYRQWDPDTFIVEKKSSGTPLYQEMRRAGVMVSEFTPVRGTQNNPNTKMARLNSVSDIIASGLVWVPPKKWAEEVVEEVAGFPFASNDDHVDTMIMALLRFRQGGFIRLPSDEEDDEPEYPRRIEYY